MTVQAILSIIFITGTAAFGYLNYKTYFTKTQIATQEQISFKPEKKKQLILQKKIIEIVEPDKETLTLIKKITKTETLPNPVPIMIRKENILEEKPSPMPSWVVTMRQQDPSNLYFIGTRTKSSDLKASFIDARRLAFEEIYKYIGVKMDYEMRIESISNEEQEEIQEKRFQEIQAQVLGNIPGIEKILVEKGNYYRKIKESDGIFYETHVMISCNIESLKKAIVQSVDKILNDLSQKIDENSQEKEKRSALLKLIKSKRDQLVLMSEKEQEAYDIKRKQYESIEREKNMSDLTFHIFLGEKNLFFGKKDESRQYLEKAFNEITLKTKELEGIIDNEENTNDSFEDRFIKRLKKSDLYFKKTNYIDGYQYTILALEALLCDYDRIKAKGLFNGSISQIDQRLFENMNQIPRKNFAEYDIVNGKILFKKEGLGNIFAYFNKAGQVLCSFIKEEEGNVYSFYSGNKIIYKLVKMNNKEAVRNFGLYDQNNRFIKEIK